MQYYRSCCHLSSCLRWKWMIILRESSCYLACKICLYPHKLRSLRWLDVSDFVNCSLNQFFFKDDWWLWQARIDMIAAACESAEKVIADTRKAYGLDTRQKASTIPNLDRAFSAKIQEKENLLRAAVNHGEGEPFNSPKYLFIRNVMLFARKISVCWLPDNCIPMLKKCSWCTPRHWSPRHKCLQLCGALHVQKSAEALKKRTSCISLSATCFPTQDFWF